MGTMSPTLPHPFVNPLSKAIRAEARAKKAHSAARFILQDAREDHAAAVAAEDAARAAEDAARVALQKAQERHAASSKAAAVALQHVQAEEVAEAEANAQLQLAQRAVKRERAAAAIPFCPEFKEKCLA